MVETGDDTAMTTAEQELESRRERLLALLEDDAGEEALRPIVEGMHPADVSDVLDDAEPEGRAVLLGLLDEEMLSEVLDESQDDIVTEILDALPPERAAAILDNSPPDEAADMVEHLDDDRAAAVLKALDGEHASHVRQILGNEPETAGRIMTTDILTALSSDTAADTLDRVRSDSETVETANTIMVVDGGAHLLGVVDLDDLVAAPEDAEVHSVMSSAILTFLPGADQEQVARSMERYDLDVVPVVDERNHLLGVVTVDDALEVMSEETSEDMYRLAGIGSVDPLGENALVRAWKRLPWLGTTLLGGLASAWIIGRYDATLDRVVALVSFMPVILGLSGNVGIQSSTITVRGLATGDLDMKDLFWLIRRELAVGALIGVICALVIGAAAHLLVGSGGGTEHLLRLCAVLGGACFIGVVTAAVIGTLAPLGCSRFGIDPAVAAGPFVTVAIDLSALSLYLAIASSVL